MREEREKGEEAPYRSDPSNDDSGQVLLRIGRKYEGKWRQRKSKAEREEKKCSKKMRGCV